MFRKIILIALIAVCLAAVFLITMSFTNQQDHSRIRRFLNDPHDSFSSSADGSLFDSLQILSFSPQNAEVHSD